MALQSGLRVPGGWCCLTDHGPYGPLTVGYGCSEMCQHGGRPPVGRIPLVILFHEKSCPLGRHSIRQHDPLKRGALGTACPRADTNPTLQATCCQGPSSETRQEAQAYSPCPCGSMQTVSFGCNSNIYLNFPKFVLHINSSYIKYIIVVKLLSLFALQFTYL